jgi:lysophospholipase L1-like esterase
MAQLVAVGDSLTQGFASGAISRTDKSYPKMIADCMGLGPNDFRLPDFTGAGGLPLNIEGIARQLEKDYGNNISNFQWIGAILDIHSYLDRVEDYWERGHGNMPLGVDVLFNNVAVFGFEVADCVLTAAQCKNKFKDTIDNVFLPIVAASRERTAYRTLNPQYQSGLDATRTQIEVCRQIVAVDGKIENLIVALGANNCLPTVVKLKVDMTGQAPPGPFSGYTLWSTSAFQQDYSLLVSQIEALNVGHVFVGNVPHVTIPPLAHGVMKNGGPLPPNEKYFDYYKYFWVKDGDFNPLFHKHLIKAQAEQIDAQIDAYNQIIADEVKRHANWHLVDLCSVLDQLAIRRNHGVPTYPMPVAIADLGVGYFQIAADLKVQVGTGLFSLDGVHPTNCGYAIMAQEFIEVMRPFVAGIKDVDFAAIRADDSLVTNPPYTLADMVGMLGALDKYFFFTEWLI